MQNLKQCDLRVITSLNEIDIIKEKWESTHWHPNSDFDYYKRYIENNNQNVNPYVVYIQCASDIKAIFVGRIGVQRIDLRIGYRQLFSPKLKVITFIYGGTLGDITETEAFMFLKHLIELLRKKTIDAILFNQLDVTTEVYKEIEKRKNKFRLYANAPYNLHWRMTLPKTMEDFYQGISYKFRKNLRRSQRKISEQYKSDILTKCFSTKEDIPRIVNQIERIAKKTYQRGLGVGFHSSKLERSLIEVSAEKGWLLCYILYVKNEAVAFERIYKYKNTLYCQDAGYNAEFRNSEPGTNLFIKVLEDNCGDDEIHYIDFGFGDASYKQRFCDFSWKEQTIILFSKSLRSTVSSILYYILIELNERSKEVLNYLGIEDKVKSVWRKISIKRN